MSRSKRSTNTTDRGFTLVETLMVIGMLGLITVVISASIIVIFRNEDGAFRLTAESHDTQQGVNYFPLDVHAGPVEAAEYDTSATASGCVSGGDNVLRFVKGDKLVAYRLTESGAMGRLDRHVCDYPSLGNHERVNVADRLDATVTPSAVANVISTGGFVESIELSLVQDGTVALVVASPRGEPLNSPGDCTTANPIEAGHGYGVFVEGHVSLDDDDGDGEITGWLGLGGTLSWRSAFRVATQNMSAVNPAYGLYADEIDWEVDRAVTTLDVDAFGLATAVAAGHGYATGQQVVIDGTGNPDIDGHPVAITKVDIDTFTFTTSPGPVSGLSGTAVAVTVAAVTDLDVSSNVATATVPSHGYGDGQLIVITGTGNTDIDGNAFGITVGNTNRFTFPVTTADVNNLTGSAITGVSLEVGANKVALGSPFTQNGDFVYENPAGPLDHHLEITANPPQAEPTAAQIDFPFDFGQLRNCSAQIAKLVDICALAGCANEVTATNTPGSPGVVNVCSTGNVPQVVNVPEQYFDGTWEFDTSGPGCQGFSQTRPLILNVIDCDDITCATAGDGVVTFDATPVDWQALGDRKNILFNFPNATVVNINNGFYGQVLAPFAHVTTDGDLEGGIIARQWTHLDGTVHSDDDLYNNPISWP